MISLSNTFCLLKRPADLLQFDYIRITIGPQV